jgi:signal transduction histidine kinase
MIHNELPVPSNEMERIINLSEFDLDFSDLENNFKDLTLLAAKITGTPMSFVNLIDSYTQWTVAQHGLDIDNAPREESICQYTIMSEDAFEVQDLSKDDRFKNMGCVKEGLALRYYLGVPLTTDEGYQIGALCVVDTETKHIEPEKITLLTIIAREIVGRLQTFRTIKTLREEAGLAAEIKKRVVHDIRGPIGGIIGLSELIKDQGENNTQEEVLEIINMIHESASSLLDLANEILTSEATKSTFKDEQFTLLVFKEKLEKLYLPQARNKHIAFTVNIGRRGEKSTIAKNKLLQITGNLITNALKFTPPFGEVTVNLDLKTENSQKFLTISIKDSGIGLSENEINAILNGTAISASGTIGEQGFGFGLVLVKQLVDKMQGTMHIFSKPGEGTVFEISLPHSLGKIREVVHQDLLG